MFLPRRRAAVDRFVGQGGSTTDPAIEALEKEPYVIETSKSIFPVLALVLVLRSFLFEPFQIPSGSMIPTLEVGDFILVNKFSYGLRLPVVGTKIVPIGDPERGDVMVFKKPDRKMNYIKRVIGLPGDTISYYNKRLTVNGQLVPEAFVAQLSDESGLYRLYEEGPEGDRHDIRKELNANDPRAEGRWVVPAGHYFVMGDNRDKSSDSRFWGFVPDHDIVGKAVYIWMHWPSWTQIPNFKNNGVIQ